MRFGRKGPEAQDATLGDMSNLPVAAASHGRVDAIDHLSHEILRRHVGRGRRGLTIAGVSDGVGVSSIALGLAQALARVGVNTLLIDGDLTASSLKAQLAPAWAGPGLAEILRGEADVEDVLDMNHGPNLAILQAGACGADGEALVFTQRFEEVLEWSLRRFQITLVDSPAASRSTAAIHMARVTGYSLLVARRHISFAQDLSLFADQMRQAGVEVVGSVLSG